MLGKNLIQAAAGNAAGEVLGVEDVFSTWLYTGNGSTQTITNGIDLAGEGGLVWIKQRSGTEYHRLTDTLRGTDSGLRSNLTAAENVNTTMFSYFNSNGFSLLSNSEVNGSGSTYASWTFRKAEKFFDVVTWTGDGASSRDIPHNLGAIPGFIIVKRTDASGDWCVSHRSSSGIGLLNSAAAFSASLSVGSPAYNGYVYALSPFSTTSTFYVEGGDNGVSNVNASGGTYVAYLFAHDAGGFGDSGDESVIKCGSYTGNGSSSGPLIDLSWEPQWLMIKRTDNTSDWNIIDVMRGMTVGGDEQWLSANLSNAESPANALSPLPTGFQVTAPGTQVNASGGTYIYIAIRRGPMKTPTSGTEVFSAVAQTGDSAAYSTGFTVDAIWDFNRNGNTYNTAFIDRLRGTATLTTSSTAAENPGFTLSWFTRNDGANAISLFGGSAPVGLLNFRRAPGFFDVVAYTGTGTSSQTVSHNLGVAPEMIIVKTRNSSTADPNWGTFHQALGNTKAIRLNQDLSALTGSQYWNDTSPTSSVFTVGDANAFNKSNDTLIAYLFATCPGVSKVGSYTGTGTTLNIDCGFTAGARFVLIKRTDSTGDWYVWDTARGIVSGDDPYLLLNSTAAEVTNTDYIDPLSSGFQISSTAPAAINASGGSFIFLAIA